MASNNAKIIIHFDKDSLNISEKLNTGKSTGRALITDIQRFSVHDGPGIRTLVFFKGCPLRCLWCQNPETINPKKELMYSKSECILCGNCINTCPNDAVSMGTEGILIDRKKCDLCDLCADTCFSGGLKIVGRSVTVDDVYDEVMKDAVFFRNTGGGVTLSGGEALVYYKFAKELLKKIKQEDIHTAIETCGFCKWPHMKEVLEYTDLVLYDIKHIDAEKHLECTKRSNELILSNLEKISLMGKSIIIRMPLIPGINDSEDTIKKVAGLAKNYNISEVHVLPFHQFGESKWYALGLDYPFSSLKPPSMRSMEKIKKLFSEIGVKVSIGGYGNDK